MLMPRLAITWSVPCRLGRSGNTTEAASDCVTANCLGSVSSRESTSYVVWWLRVDRKCFQTTGQQVGSRKAILFSATLRWLYIFLCSWQDGERGASQTSRQQALRKHLMRILVLPVRTPSTENVETTRI